MDSRGRAGVCAVVTSALVLGLGLVVPPGRPAPATAAPVPAAQPQPQVGAAFNPVAGSEGFNVFVNGNAELNGGSEIWGPLAVGGDLAIGPTNLAYKAPASASTSARGPPGRERHRP